ncbi:MAG TPA: phage tail tip lysozyme [Rhodanobacteraceae bacterium]|nr:phage tail tip lysozyme [Rhodanobacteraceae bacterium]
MASVIESFYIALGLDTKDYEKKRKEVDSSLKKFGEASDKQTKLIAESGKKAAGAFSALKIEILGALAAFGMGAGFKAFIQDNMNAQAATGRWSSLLKVSAHEMQAWGGIAKGMGGSAQEAVQTMQSLASGFTEAQNTGSSSLMQASRRWGFAIYQDPLKTLDSLHERMLKAVNAGRPEQAEMIGQSAGVQSQAMLFYLMQNQKKYLEMQKQMLAATGGMDPKSTEKAAELQWQLALLEARFSTIGTKIFNKIGPVLIKLGKQFANWLDHVDWNKVINAIGRFIDKVQAIVKEMGGWKTVAEILGGILALKILAPLLSLTTTLARLLPMFTGAATGVGGLAAAFGTLGVALAGVAGYWAGSEIWTHVLAGTKAGDAVGSMAAHVMAQLGNKEAQDAVNRMNGKGPKAPSNYHPERTDWYKNKESQAIQYFQSQGFSRNAAIGMAANIARESNFNQHVVGDNGKAFGIGQWHPDRQANFAKVMGLPIQGSSYAQQLEFYAYEVKHNIRLMDILRRDPGAGQAAMAVSLMNERPANGEAEAQRRALIAQSMSNGYVGAPSIGASVAKNGPSTTTNDVHIGTIAIHTKADNAHDIFKEARKAVQANPLIAGSVTAAA